jgi:hypothetical protein
MLQIQRRGSSVAEDLLRLDLRDECEILKHKDASKYHGVGTKSVEDPQRMLTLKFAVTTALHKIHGEFKTVAYAAKIAPCGGLPRNRVLMSAD